MLPSRYTFNQPQNPNNRKSRLSYLPKPRNAGSTDRLSAEARRPSNVSNARSSSAEADRRGPRLSREASATKIPLNRRSKSQQNDNRFSQAPFTPLRGSHNMRPTTTPQRTPSEDRSSRNWQTSLDRALAYVTVKDQRPISTAAYQRQELQRCQSLLSMLGVADGGAGMALMRPLTITRFVDISGHLLRDITGDHKLTNDNYVTKIPHIAKVILYPGVVSKSWLKTVNTLHAFPNALAFIAYLLDLNNRIQIGVDESRLYRENDELAILRRDFLCKSWIRFQEPDVQYNDIDEEYLYNLKQLLGNHDEIIQQLKEDIVNREKELSIEDESNRMSCQEENRRLERRDALEQALREERNQRNNDRMQYSQAKTYIADEQKALKELDAEIERATIENEQLSLELESQCMTVEERARLLDEVDYANRVQDSKKTLAEQMSKMLYSKEATLASWQNKTLNSCVEYKKGLLQLAPRFPELAKLAIDENDLMSEECLERVRSAVNSLKKLTSNLNEELSTNKRAKIKERKMTEQKIDETRAQIAKLKEQMKYEQEALATEMNKEAEETNIRNIEEKEEQEKLETLKSRQDEYLTVENDLQFWQQQQKAWKTRLTEMKTVLKEKKEESVRVLEEAKKKRIALFVKSIKEWNEALEKAKN